MATAFPAIRPSSRRFRGASFPTTQVKSQSGVTSTRLWGSKSEGATLELRFNNIPDAQALLIGQAYDNAKGPVDSLTVPDEIFSGAEPALQSFLRRTGTGVSWHFTQEAPDIESIVNGISSVSVTLVAQLRI